MKLNDRSHRSRLLRDARGLTLTWLGLALILLFTPPSIQAHGGGVPQLINAKAGPYRVSVCTQPDPIRVCEFHLTLAV